MGHYNPADDPAVTNGIQEAYGFKIGDVVEFTNQYGVKFSPHKVVGFVQNVNPDWLPENTVYIDSDSPWYPVKPSSLKIITQGGLKMVDPIGASHPVIFERDDGGLQTCRLSDKQADSERLRALDELTPEQTEVLKGYGERLRFPAKNGDLRRRWCSAYLKIDVAAATLRNLEQTRANAKILIVSGERRGESVGRSKYNEMELHGSHAPAKAKRVIQRWRPVIDYTLRDVWEVCRRHKLTPHPCYTAGWNRCSCMMCIFSLPSHWAGIRELFPREYAAICEDERRLQFTLDNKKPLDEFVGDAASCVCRDDPAAIERLTTGNFSHADIYTDHWRFPAGAFKGSAGGPC